jgi:transposase
VRKWRRPEHLREIMPEKKYIVALEREERKELESITTKGKAPAYRINHARILLKADINHEKGGLRDKEISEALDISVSTIERVRQRFVEESVESAISRRKPLKARPRLLDGEKEANLIAIACTEAPEGRGAWTLRLLADKMVELGHVESISHETVRQTLKKTN